MSAGYHPFLRSLPLQYIAHAGARLLGNGPFTHYLLFTAFTQALGYTMTVLGFGWYNYAKLQQQPARETHGKHGGAEAQRLLETEAEAAEAAEAAVAAATEPGDALASLPPGLRAALEFAMERLVRWGLADAVLLTASLASSLPLNLAVYVVSGVFQPLFIMEMGYAGVGQQLGLLYMLPYYAGMACVLPFATRPLRLFSHPPLPWRKIAAITTVDLASNPKTYP
jgi:hypothetical protein